MDEIIMSIANGGRKQALIQLYRKGYTFEDLIMELLAKDDSYEILVMYRIAINHDYLSEEKYYVLHKF